jgi:hypothetical protein
MSRLIMKLALALLPPSRCAWGRAMELEFAHLEVGQTAFAWGCLGASLKENVTTIAGLARLGFGIALIFSLWMAAFWVQVMVELLASAQRGANAKAFYAISVGGFSLYPVALSIAADRHRLAEIGHKATCACLVIAAILDLALCVCSVLFIIEANSTSEPIETSLNIGLARGTVFLIVAWCAYKGPRLMRNVGAITSLLLLVYSGVLAIQQADQPEIMGHNLLPTALSMVALMSFPAALGALFLWMQRPIQSVELTEGS